MAEGYEGLNGDFSNRLQQLVNASGGKLSIRSGYRSVEEQSTLWNNAVAKYGEVEARRWVAPPGQSNHNRGMAADLAGDLDWAHAHAAEFGLTFPLDNEAWHIEPAGIRDGSYTPGSGGSGTPPTPAPGTPATPTNTLAQGLEIVNNSLYGPTDEDPIAGVLRSRPVRTPSTGAEMPATPGRPPAPPGTSPGAVSGALAGGAAATGQGGGTPVGALGGAMAGSNAATIKGQLKAGFNSVGRGDLADMVDTQEFDTWINQESGWQPDVESAANNQGLSNYGLFQFWRGHDWMVGGMSVFDQAATAATQFNLTPDRIRGFAAEINAGSYVGWG